MTRRTAVLTGASTLATAIAGCLGDDGAPPGTGDAAEQFSVQSSFFVVYDFARSVAGDAAAVGNLVPFGQHGHGWEPGPDVQRRVLGADAFVYVGEGFQPWADDVVRNVGEDDADVAVVEAWADVDLLDADHHDEGDGEDDRHSDDEDGHHGEEDGDEHHDGDDPHSDDAGDHHEDADDHTTHETDPDHGTKDPHYWLDPERAAQSVETIADGLAAADLDNAATYEGNADAYVDRLADLDSTFEAGLEDRTRDTILLAGHNSFGYLGHRYGFQVEALSGLSPDATPSPRDVRRAQAVIEEHDVEHVLAPVFESDRAATQLVEETAAREVLPLTPVPSLKAAWADDGWGFVDVMENVNLPSLRTALGVE